MDHVTVDCVTNRTVIVPADAVTATAFDNLRQADVARLAAGLANRTADLNAIKAAGLLDPKFAALARLMGA